MIFEKKDIIVSSTMGLCVVADITKLSADKTAPIAYYVLKSYYDKSKVAYIPVENHEVELRDPMYRDAAEACFDEYKKGYSMDPHYEPDEAEIGEVAYVMGVSIEELKKQAGAPTKEDE